MLFASPSISLWPFSLYHRFRIICFCDIKIGCCTESALQKQKIDDITSCQLGNFPLFHLFCGMMGLQNVFYVVGICFISH